MTYDTFFITSIVICLTTVVFQVLAYCYWRGLGLAVVTPAPFLLNGIAFTSMHFPKLCEPRTPGCEMGGIAVAYGVMIVAAATALTVVSAIVIWALGWHWHKNEGLAHPEA